MTAAKPAVKPTPFKIEHICGRSACRAPNASYWHKHLHTWYCTSCSRSINEYTKNDGHGQLLTVPKATTIVSLSRDQAMKVDKLEIDDKLICYEIWIDDALYSTAFDEPEVLKRLVELDPTVALHDTNPDWPRNTA